MGIVIVGLGPSDGRLITREAWQTAVSSKTLYVRTEWHPVIDELRQHTEIVGFDHLYESQDDFTAVYNQIVTMLLDLALEHEQVIYAVPGHPFVGESTVPAIIEQAQEKGIGVNIVEGLSFVEPTITAINNYLLAHNQKEWLIDGMTNLQICDALDLLMQNYPQVNADAFLLIGQVYSRSVAGELKLSLMAIFPDEHPVFLVHHASAADAQIEAVPLYEFDHSDQIDHLSSLYVPPLPEASDLTALAEAVAVLRGPNGCPWDQEQTPLTMRDGLVEEVSEVLEALDSGDPQALCEELGDVLLHVLMQTQMASEVGDFTLSDVIAGIVSKLIRRHPHVWGDVDAADSEQVVKNWEAIKLEEKEEQNRPLSVLDNIPKTLPALAQSHKIQKRVRKAGFDWATIDGVYDKLQEEVRELQTAETPEQQMMELGDILFVVVNLGKWLKLDPESALREANLRFSRRFRLAEQLAQERQLEMNQMSEAALLEIWLEAKAQLAEVEAGK